MDREVVIYAWVAFLDRAPKQRFASINTNYAAEIMYFFFYRAWIYARYINFYVCSTIYCRSQWPHGLRRGSAVAHLLRLWIRIPPGAWISVCCECWVLSGRGVCDKLITRPEQSFRLWCVVVCDPETSWMRRPWPTGGCCANTQKKKT